MNRDTIIKTNFIFKKFEEINAKIWNIDTDIFNMWKRFIDLLKTKFSFNDFNFNELIIEPIPHPDNDNKKDNYFFIRINGIDVTPRKHQPEKGWSNSATRQFLQIGSSFGLIIYSPDQKIDNGAIFKISPKIASILNDDFDWGYFLLVVIKNSVFSCAKHINNLGHSLFFCYVMRVNPNILKSFENTIQFDWRRNQKKNWPFHSKEFSICEEYAKTIYEQTYGQLVNFLSEYIFDNVINDLFDEIATKEESESLFADKINLEDQELKIEFISMEENENYLKNIKKYDKLLSNERSKLRQSIIEDRAKNKCKYSDLSLLKETYIDFSEAAHIYDIKSIKKQIRNYLILKQSDLNDEHVIEIIKQASNSNNGLLMPRDIHEAYDRDTFQFDISGDIIYQKENEEKIISLSLQNCKIRNDVLNSQMIDFLKKRLI
ncbi:MAG: HNH endonuclease [Malacoplasma sp.]